MKVIPFTIPVPTGSSVHIQHEKLAHFYEHLHQHREVQITLVVKGTGSLLASNQLHPFSSGDLFLIGANVPHVFKSDPAYFSNTNSNAVEAWTIFLIPRAPCFLFFHCQKCLPSESGSANAPAAPNGKTRQQEFICRFCKT